MTQAALDGLAEAAENSNAPDALLMRSVAADRVSCDWTSSQLDQHSAFWSRELMFCWMKAMYFVFSVLFVVSSTT